MLYINNCRKIQVLIKVIFIKNKIKRIVRTFDKTIISTRLDVIILVRICNKELFESCNLIFISTTNLNRFDFKSKVLLYIIDVNLCAIQVNNILV